MGRGSLPPRPTPRPFRPPRSLRPRLRVRRVISGSGMSQRQLLRRPASRHELRCEAKTKRRMSSEAEGQRLVRLRATSSLAPAVSAVRQHRPASMSRDVRQGLRPRSAPGVHRCPAPTFVGRRGSFAGRVQTTPRTRREQESGSVRGRRTTSAGQVWRTEGPSAGRSIALRLAREGAKVGAWTSTNPVRHRGQRDHRVRRGGYAHHLRPDLEHCEAAAKLVADMYGGRIDILQQRRRFRRLRVQGELPSIRSVEELPSL